MIFIPEKIRRDESIERSRPFSGHQDSKWQSSIRKAKSRGHSPCVSNRSHRSNEVPETGDSEFTCQKKQDLRRQSESQASNLPAKILVMGREHGATAADLEVSTIVTTRPRLFLSRSCLPREESNREYHHVSPRAIAVSRGARL